MVRQKTIDIIEHLINFIDLRYLNYSIIKYNSEYLYELFIKIKKHWLIDENIKHIELVNENIKYKEIMKTINNSIMCEYDYINKILKGVKKIIKLNDGNITFYYIDLGKYDEDKKQINELFFQSVCLIKFNDLYKKGEIIIIWIPTETERNFNYSIINKENINLSIKNFEAFTASGVTFNNNPRITIITRYEEISKLLIHELIHNINLDGSGYHSHNKTIIEKYKKIKNPETKNKIKNYDYSYSIYESYTELLSSYLSMIFRNINLIKKEEIIKRFETEIIIEILYSYNTIANLIKLNNYKTYEDFEKQQKFEGDICIYEYYFLKALMYNNYKLKLCNNQDEFNNNYEIIININKKDPLLKSVFNNMKKQTNFRYIFYD
jgi:hypothetical protein